MALLVDPNVLLHSLEVAGLAVQFLEPQHAALGYVQAFVQGDVGDVAESDGNVLDVYSCSPHARAHACVFQSLVVIGIYQVIVAEPLHETLLVNSLFLFGGKGQLEPVNLFPSKGIT